MSASTAPTSFPLRLEDFTAQQLEKFLRSYIQQQLKKIPDGLVIHGTFSFHSSQDISKSDWMLTYQLEKGNYKSETATGNNLTDLAPEVCRRIAFHQNSKMGLLEAPSEPEPEPEPTAAYLDDEIPF